MRSNLLCCTLLMLAALGCQTPKNGKPLAKDLSGNDPETQVSFWHALTEEQVTSNDQAFHGLLLYADGKDDCADYNARVVALKSRKMIPQNFNEPAEQGVRRGVVAVAICKIINDKGGLTMHIVGPWPRYAVRELMFNDIYPPSTPNQSFSGTEFVGIIGRVEDYQRGGDPTDEPARIMPSEGDAQ